MKNWFIIAAVLVNINSLCCTAQCTYGNSPPTATIGKRLVLSCSLQCATETQYKWVNVTGPNEVILPDATGSELVLSENVSSQVANQIFGEEFECQIECQGTTDCRRFKIGVIPRAYFNRSSQVAKTGSGVNITCMSESYPPATDVDNYQMKHPNNTPITKVLTPEGNGVVHIINAASKGQDAGEYLCIVHVTLRFDGYPPTPLQSDAASARLVVYDPPNIVSVNNFTNYDYNQTAILECTVSSTEKNLMVWVNWSESDGKAIAGKHYEFQSNGVYFLLLYHAKPGDYLCQVFSTLSPDIPEDTQTVSVVMPADSPTSASEALTPKPQEKCSYSPYIAAIVVLTIIMISIIITLMLLLWFLRVKKVKKFNLHTTKLNRTTSDRTPPTGSCEEEAEGINADSAQSGQNVISNVQVLAEASNDERGRFSTANKGNDSEELDVFVEPNKVINEDSSLPHNRFSRTFSPIIKNFSDRLLRNSSSSSVESQPLLEPDEIGDDCNKEQFDISRVDSHGMPPPSPKFKSGDSPPKSAQVKKTSIDEHRFRRRLSAPQLPLFPLTSSIKLPVAKQKSVDSPLDSIREWSSTTEELESNTETSKKVTSKEQDYQQQ